MNKSPLRYPGGKTRACKQLDSIVAEHFDMSKIHTIISPFFGGGSFEFHLQYRYGLHIIANDKFTPLYHFWKTCKTEPDRLCQELTKHIHTIDKQKFINLRDQIMEETDIFQQSIMYFIINRCSFSGSTLSGGFSPESATQRFTYSSIDKIKSLDLSRFDIYNLDYEEFIRSVMNDQHILFLDPPYYLEKGSKLYGKNGDMHDTFDHERLYRCLSQTKKWILTYNNCEYITTLYKDYTIIETNWTYGMNASKKSSEIVIIGSPFFNPTDII